jgi:hypothetical protein
MRWKNEVTIPIPASERNVANKQAYRTLVAAPAAAAVSSPWRAPSPTTISPPRGAMISGAVPPHCSWYLHMHFIQYILS